MQWCGHPSSSANITINLVHMTCLSSRARSEVFVGMSVISLRYSPTSRAQTRSPMDSQCASKLLIPLLTVGFMTPPREAAAEKVSRWLHSSRNRGCAARMDAARERSPLFPSQSLGWSQDPAPLFHNRPRHAVPGLRPQLGRVQLPPAKQLSHVGIPTLLLFLITPALFSRIDLLLGVRTAPRTSRNLGILMLLLKKKIEKKYSHHIAVFLGNTLSCCSQHSLDKKSFATTWKRRPSPRCGEQRLAEGGASFES